jgi:predicted secreted hydrolase
MRSSLCILATLLLLLSLPVFAEEQFRAALPGYRYEFPRDHFNHPDFQTEWWYYTGNVRSADGHRFGFELTFFRQAVDRDPMKTSVWEVRDLYLAHLGLSDLSGSAFYHTQRINRAGPGIAGVSQTSAAIWNGNWRIDWTGNEQELRAIDSRFQLILALHSEKPPIIHGENGVSQKAAGPGRASHYISLTRLATKGTIVLGGKQFDVTGLAWMDHEFFTHQLEADQTGWDWLSLQLDDQTELMLFRIRRKDGLIDSWSAGTFVDAHGAATHLRASDFTLKPLGDSWKSPVTTAQYPVRWQISVPRLGIELEGRTQLPSQELTDGSKLTPNYWEGSIDLTGRKTNTPLTGSGYLEMTGYDRPVDMGR